MADRVFPNNVNVDMGSKVEFSGINWDAVQASLTNNRFAQDNTDKVLELLEQAGYGDLSEEQVQQIDDLVKSVTENKEGMDGMKDEEAQDKMKSMGDEEDEDYEDDGDEMKSMDEMKDDTSAMHDIASWKTSGSNKMRKIAFTNPSQISAEAIELAMANGDAKLVNTILAARKENRNRIASAIKEKSELEIRKAQRASIVKKAQEDSSEDEMTCEECGEKFEKGTGVEGDKYCCQECADKDITTAFVSPAKFTQAQRESFKKIALASGMPKEYVDAMCGTTPVSPRVETLNRSINEVYASNLSDSVKTATIKTLIKEAKLSADSKSEFINYWNNVLGYQDKSFWPDVAADYTDGTKSAGAKSNIKTAAERSKKIFDSEKEAMDWYRENKDDWKKPGQYLDKPHHREDDDKWVITITNYGND